MSTPSHGFSPRHTCSRRPRWLYLLAIRLGPGLHNPIHGGHVCPGQDFTTPATAATRVPARTSHPGHGGHACPSQDLTPRPRRPCVSRPGPHTPATAPTRVPARTDPINHPQQKPEGLLWRYPLGRQTLPSIQIPPPPLSWQLQRLAKAGKWGSSSTSHSSHLNIKSTHVFCRTHPPLHLLPGHPQPQPCSTSHQLFLQQPRVLPCPRPSSEPPAPPRSSTPRPPLLLCWRPPSSGSSGLQACALEQDCPGHATWNGPATLPPCHAVPATLSLGALHTPGSEDSISLALSAAQGRAHVLMLSTAPRTVGAPHPLLRQECEC